MSRPDLSFVVPAHPAGAPLVARFLRSLMDQTAPKASFEVVVAVDGPDPGEAIRRACAPFTALWVQVVDSPRPSNFGLPHRNHARNAAIRAALGRYLWIIDSDFIWEPNAVAHAVTLMDAAAKAGKVLALSPILIAINEDPNIWVAQTASWVEGLETHDTLAMLKKVRTGGEVYSGFADQRRAATQPPASVPKQIPEGFPLVSRALMQAIGGFDEAFIGWGGNKEEFCRRLGALRPLGVSYEVLRTVTAYHQPHAPDPRKKGNDTLRRANQARFTEKLQAMERNPAPAWWQEQVDRTREVIAAAQRAINPAAAPVRKPRKAPARPPAKASAPPPAPEVPIVADAGTVEPNVAASFVSTPENAAPEAHELADAAPAEAQDGAPEATEGGANMPTRSAPHARVGIVTLTDPRKGIVRDVEIIAHALSQPRAGWAPPTVSLFHVADSAGLGSGAASRDAKTGATWGAFLAGVDVVVLSEMLPVSAVDAALGAGKRVIYIPNADWSCIDGDVAAWVRAVAAFQKRAGFVVLAKSSGYADILRTKQITANVIPWIAPDAVVRDREPHGGPVRFYASLGMGGWNRRRGADTIVEAWKLLGATPAEAVLTIKTIRPLAEQVDGKIPGDIRVREGMASRDDVGAAWASHDVVLYPSRWDGFGLSLSEALNAGLPAIVPDAWPMDEQVRDGHNGIVVASKRVGWTRLAPHVEMSPADLAAAMRRLIDDRALLARLTAPHPGERVAKQHAMVEALQHQICGLPRKRALIVCMDGKGRDKRRSEHYWKAALEAHGYEVEMHPRGRLAALPPLAVDFALVAKITPEDAVRVRHIAGEAPVICWHHDLTDYTPDRWRWQLALAQAVDLTLVPEGDLHRFQGVAVRTLMPGSKAAVVRPTTPLRAPTGRVVFLGSCDGETDERVTTVRALANAGIPVDVYGPRDEWANVGIEAKGYAADDAARDAYDGSLALCVSRGGHVRLYTSNRLFNAAGSGAIPVVLDFPGLLELYPPGTAVTFKGPDLVGILKAVAADAGAMARVQRKACAHTWRHHTWHDRVAQVIRCADALIGKRVAKQAPPAPRVATPATAPAFGSMWEDRARKLGPRAVGHVKHTDAQCRAQIAEWWAKLSRHLVVRLKDYDRRILDFGCGVGRFTPLIGALPGKEVIGVDVSPSMVEMARRASPAIDFRVVDPRRLPFPDGYFDALWTCTVLQHIPDAEFPHVARELRRVLKPDAVVLLFENTNQHGKRTSNSGHVVFRKDIEYRNAFPGLGSVEAWPVERETHTVITGRLAPKR